MQAYVLVVLYFIGEWLGTRWCRIGGHNLKAVHTHPLTQTPSNQARVSKVRLNQAFVSTTGHQMSLPYFLVCVCVCLQNTGCFWNHYVAFSLRAGLVSVRVSQCREGWQLEEMVDWTNRPPPGHPHRAHTGYPWLQGCAAVNLKPHLDPYINWGLNIFFFKSNWYVMGLQNILGVHRFPGR